jgi:Zn-dependent metalloprotease
MTIETQVSESAVLPVGLSNSQRGYHRMTSGCRCVNCIVPPHITLKLLQHKDKDVRQAALNTLLASTRLRTQRRARPSFLATSAPANGRCTVFDAHGSRLLSDAATARTQDGPPSPDDSVNQAFDGLSATRDFYKDIFNRDSIDNRGMRLDGYVHYDMDYNNAFFDGTEMVFGSGDGQIFGSFTRSVDVIGHELTHGVTQFTAGLNYSNQSGALNESISDVFGSLVKQWVNHQTADQADWLIGAELFAPGFDAGGLGALRSMKSPGEAYDNDQMGKDPQPDNISKYVQLPDTDVGDNGGVHTNSGIPNKAFYETAIRIGGYAWEAPGQIWYESLKASNPDTQFQDFADTTYAKAGELYRVGSPEQQAVVAAWREVGIKITDAPQVVAIRRRWASLGGGGGGAESDRFAVLSQQIDELSNQVKALAKDLVVLKKRPAA